MNWNLILKFAYVVSALLVLIQHTIATIRDIKQDIKRRDEYEAKLAANAYTGGYYPQVRLRDIFLGVLGALCPGVNFFIALFHALPKLFWRIGNIPLVPKRKGT